MKRLFLAGGLSLQSPQIFATEAHAQQTVTFLCAPPAGHVC
jgi:hypothetical protein